MSRGSFEGLYTFREVGEIYDIDYRIAFYMKLKLYDIFKINKGQTLFTWLNYSQNI